MSRAPFTIFGAGAGECWGSLGYLGGPVVGTVTTVGSAIIGSVAGYYMGPCCEDVAATAQKVKETVNNASQTVESVNGTVCEATKTVQGIKNITSTGHGACILVIGLSLALGLWMMGAECNPKCRNENAEYIRLASTALMTTGVAVVGISGVKSIFF